MPGEVEPQRLLRNSSRLARAGEGTLPAPCGEGQLIHLLCRGYVCIITNVASK